MLWRKVAPTLSQDYFVVMPDLRGYGDSSEPPGGGDHFAYSKRAMAQDQLEVKTHLGFEKFALVGHDRGGRVAHRLAFDHRSVHEARHSGYCADLSAVSAHHRRVRDDFLSLVQPSPFPETMVQNSAEYFLKCTLLWLGGNKLTDRCPTGSAPPCFRNICASFAGPTLSMPFVKIIARQARSTSRTIRQTSKKRFSARCSCCGRKGAVPSHVRRSANVARAGRPGGGQGNADRPFLPDQMPEELTQEIRTFLGA